MRKPPFSVARGLVRMSWNKTNLYNMVHQKLPSPAEVAGKSLFQQKWLAKRLTRGYHGDRMTEKEWQRLFATARPFLPPSSSLSNTAAPVGGGGGSGERGGEKKMSNHPAALLYSQLEQRLDVLLFRCLFAPSVYQAKQMIVHGHVRINGKKVVICGN